MHSLRKSWFKSILVPQTKTSAIFSSTQTEVQTEQTGNEIVIPKRIERGPTDILKALSQTVKRDPLAPHYKYHDDPFTIPVSNTEKRAFALAQESGKKAAQWIKQTHSELFQHKVASPHIDLFAPKLVYSDEEPVSLDFLSKLIATSSVTDAIKTYQRLETDNIEVPDELKQSLLELVCYFNGEDSVAEDLFEERWFTQPKFKAPKHNTWKDNDFAEGLFRSYPNPNVEQYASIIQGMLKHNQVERGVDLFNEAKNKGLILPVDTYNLLLDRVNFMKEGFEQRWQQITEYLGEMNQANIKPNIGTLNAIIRQLGYMASFRESKRLTLKTLNEMKKFDIKPSLITYNNMLYIFCRDRGPLSGILYTILDEIEARLQSGEKIEVKDVNDNQFFSGAMEIARRHLSDVNCAYRIDRILHQADHYNYIGDSYRESTYYRNFFEVTLTQEPFETFMELYDRLVPNVYSPEKNIMQDIINAADLNGAVEYLPRLWSEIVMLDLWQQDDMLYRFLEVLNKNLPVNNEQLVKQLADVVWSVYFKVEELNENVSESRSRRRAIEWTGPALGDILNVLVADKRLSNAHEIFSKLLKETLAGIPDLKTLENYLEATIQDKNLSKSLSILTYINELGFENIHHLGEKIESNFELTAAEKTKVLVLSGGSKEQTKANDLEKDSV